jgi:hypothetical protein
MDFLKSCFQIWTAELQAALKEANFGLILSRLRSKSKQIFPLFFLAGSILLHCIIRE